MNPTQSPSEPGSIVEPLIPPLQPADLPERKLAFWRMTGPGAVLVGLSIGAGEIVIWPRIAAQYGPSMIWAAALGVFLQLWINIEIGRWTIATGESAYLGFARAWRGFAVAFLLFNFFGWFFPGWARISGTALKALVLGPTHDSPDWLWTAITFGAVALMLFGPKRVYATVERVTAALVIIITVGLIFIAIRIGTLESAGQMIRGIANVGYKAPDFPMRELFSALVFAGAGGTANLFYSFYLRDKRIGMGARFPTLINPFRQRETAASVAGYIYPETSENRRSIRDWLRYLFLDQVLYFWLLNTFTMMLFIYGSVVVLWPQGIVPSPGSLIWDEAQVLSQSMGVSGRYLFLVIGLATLFSTQITLVDGVSRSMADILHSSSRLGRRIPEAKWYVGWAIFMMVFGIVITYVLEKRGVSELGFLFNTGYIGGFAMAIYVPLLLWINLRYLPRSARPGWINIVMVGIAAIIYIGFAAFCIYGELQKRGMI